MEASGTPPIKPSPTSAESVGAAIAAAPIPITDWHPSVKVVVGLIVAGLGLVLPAVGIYSIPAIAQGAVTAAEYAAASYAVKEEGVLADWLHARFPSIFG